MRPNIMRALWWLFLAPCLLGVASRSPRQAQTSSSAGGRLTTKAFEFPYSMYETFIPEGQANQKNFFSVNIKTSLPVKYQMTSLIDSRSQRLFNIDETTGDISTVSDINREFMPVHYFKVTGISQEEPRKTATTTLQISIKDLNDNAPIFELSTYNASVRESLPIGSSIVTVRASDADSGDNGRVSYSLGGQNNEGSGLFRIDPNSGVLTLRGILDREAKAVHVLNVVARDNAVPASERLRSNATILVQIVDENDNVPAFGRRIYYMDIREDLSASERPVIGKVTATDLDDGQNALLKYSIIGGNTGNAFAISPEDGQIYLQKSIDREKQDSYKLIIRAQDLGNPPKSNTTQVVINVLDVNDNDPRFPNTNYYQSVAENVPKGYSILQVTAFDPDQGLNSKIEYSLRDPNPDLPFGVDKTTGWIHTIEPLDREVSGSYRFYVEAKDQGSPRSRSAISTIQISVLDRNDNDPVMSQRSYDIVVSESEPLGSEILKVVATDPDQDSEIRYEIVGGNVAHAFSISSRQGVGIITIAQPLDFNKEKFFRLNVNAVDSGGRFATSAVNINITDSNNNAPKFENTPYVVDVFEDTPVGSTVLMLFASDLDSGQNAKINYRLESPSETFKVERDTGALVVASTVDRESVSTFILTVLAEDSGLAPLSDRTDVEITVIDVNDNSPRFPSGNFYSGNVQENAPAGTSILEVSAHDEDIGENGKVRYRFVGDSESFSIDAVAGIIRTKRPLDREAKEYYDLTIEAYDAGIPEMTGEVKVGITILDLNDNPPSFREIEEDGPNKGAIVFSFPENLPSGSKVGTIHVTDPDIGSNSEVRFRLLNTTLDEQFFFIDDSSSSGSTVLYTRKEFDYEVDRRQYQLQLRAESDPLRADVLVVVKLADVNDNYPIIQDFNIIFNQRLDEPFAGPIGYVPATDADPTSKLQYNFTYGNTGNLLHLDSSTGAIKLSQSLKSNVNVQAKVGVSVTDGKNEARANFRLKINHVTDSMLENAVTLRIANVSATEFLSPFYEYLIEGLSVVVPCHKSQIHIFSLKDDDEDPFTRVLNVTFSVSVAGTHNEDYLKSDYIKERVYLQYNLLKKLLLLQILPFDDNICVREPCLNYETCSSQMKIANTDENNGEPLKGLSLLFRSVDPLMTYTCSCPAGYTGMKNRYTCDTKINLCYSNPCANGSTCLSRENGYVCLCPENFAGKHCEIDMKAGSECLPGLCHLPSQCAPLIEGGLTCQNCSDNPFNDQLCRLRARSFTLGTYAAFPSLRQRDKFNITIEFATQQSTGLIFYNGRLNNENDFIALEIRGKSVVFKFYTGAPDELPGEVSLTRENEGFSDGMFHRVEVRYSNESATIVVGENCDEKLALKFGHQLSDKYRCANRTKIERLPDQCGFYAGRCVRFLDLTGPMILGNGGYKHDHVEGSQGFVGCLKDLHIDHQMVNLAMMVHNNGSISGCPEKRNFCASFPCKNGGQCSDGWGSYQCQCDSQYTGKDCSIPVGRTFGFKSGSELGYRQELSPIQLPWQMGLSVRIAQEKTQKSDQQFNLMSVKMGNDEMYTIVVKQGMVHYVYDGKVLMTSGLFGVADGKWHDIQIKWMKDEVWLNIDYGQYEITQQSFNSVGGKVVTKVMVGDSSDKENYVQGCVRNIKIGMGDSESPEVAYEKMIETCPETCPPDDEDCENKVPCSGPGCFCPFKDDNKCVDDVCSLELCSLESQCQSSIVGGYTCHCGSIEVTEPQYCTPKEEEICPSHWYGKPVCGPCNCDVSQGFNESCSMNGTCSCQANHFVKNGKCHPCDCYPYGSLSQQCDVETGACRCRSGVSGVKCDKCSHGFAELTSKGCNVIYSFCPAEYASGIWWPRTVFGDPNDPLQDLPNATCPENSVGLARRPCTKQGWESPDLSGCIHQDMILLRNQVKNGEESWILAKKAREAIDQVGQQYSRNDLYPKDFEMVDNSTKKIFDLEADAEGFELAHKKDRHFLDNFLNVVSWLFTKNDINSTISFTDMDLIAKMSVYGRKLLSSMDITFTNPLEVVSENVIFGLDQVGAKGRAALLRHRSRRADLKLPQIMTAPGTRNLNKYVLTTIPKYNNYIKRTTSWSLSQAEIVTMDEETAFQYTIYRTNKSAIDKKHLLAPRGMYSGTEVTFFSDIVSITVGREDNRIMQPLMVNSEITMMTGARGGQGVSSKHNYVRSVIFQDRLKSPTNRVYCMAWDRDLWTDLKCETDSVNLDLQRLSVNCSCITPNSPHKVTVAVLEESITDGHDYLDTKEDSFIFSICSSVSLVLLLLTSGCLTLLNTRRKTSIKIHRNIVLAVLGIQILILIVVLANTQLTSLTFLCTFITMALHYGSVAMYVWIAVESIHIYRMLSELRDINHGRTTFYSAAGFGIPGLVVGLTMGVSGSTYRHSAFCWLSYNNSSVWGMLGPEVICAVVHMVTMLLNLRTVFRVKTDLEDFSTLRTVFFVNACLLPLVTGFHVTALIMINDPGGTHAMYTYAGVSVLLAIYLLCGFIICDKTIMRALAQYTGQSKKPGSSGGGIGGGGDHSTSRLTRGGGTGTGTNVAMSTHHISRSSLTYGQRGKHYNYPNNLDAGAEVSVASTTSQSTYQTSSKFKSSHHTNLDEPDYQDRYYHGGNGSDSDSDIDRRSLDLASSHSSDDEYGDHSDLKHLSVHDFPQY